MELENNLIKWAAEVYGRDESEISMETNISAELSNQSMLMIVFISCIEDEYDIEIELQDAAQLVTLGDYASLVKTILGC